MTSQEFRTALIARSASHIGEGERQPNRSEFIDAANAYTRVPMGSPYCISALLFIANQICEEYGHGIQIPRIASAVRFFEQAELKFSEPQPGYIMIWQRIDEPTKGHAGLVSEVLPGGKFVRTIEFNTGGSDATVQREGDGVSSKQRSRDGTNKMRVLGYVMLG